MNNLTKVLMNLVLYSAILYAGIIVMSKVFDKGTEAFLKLDDKMKKVCVLVVLAIVALIPIVLKSNVYLVRACIMALTYIVLALSLNFVIGFAGQLSMGHSAFYAVGAYTTAILTVIYGVNFWIALVLSGVVAAVFGLLLGLPTLRLRGDYLAIVTIGFGEILRLVLINWTSFTRGPAGIPGVPSPKFFGLQTGFYYLLLILAVFTIILSYRLLNSRLGRALIAIRDDEIAAEAIGVNPMFLKILAFVLGAAIAGLVGGVQASFIHYVNPDSFTYAESVVILTMVVLGGVGSVPGIIIGATVLAVLPEALRGIATYRYAIYGILLILMMIVRPQGMISMASLKGGARHGKDTGR